MTKEFGRDSEVECIALRLGYSIVEGDLEAASGAGEPAALSTLDMGTAIERALTAKIDGWQVVHVQSPVPRARYLMGAAAALLGYPTEMR